MGNSNSVIDFEHKITATDYKPVQRIKDPRLGEFVQMKNSKTGHIILKKEKRFADYESYQKKIEEYMDCLPVKHKSLGQFYGFSGSDSQEIFKNQHKISIYFEMMPESLHSNIFKRKVPAGQKSNILKTHSYFAEKELLSIMTQLVDVLEYLQGNSITHGEIKPDTCFLSEDGTVKVMNRMIIGSEVSTFELAKKGDKSVFASPLVFESIKKKQEEPLEDKYKADVFSLGMTLLECATLKSSAQVYDWNNFTLNLNTLSSRLLEMKERYSLNLYKILREMLTLQEDQRPDFIALKKLLVELNGVNILSSTYLPTEEVLENEQVFTAEPKQGIKIPAKKIMGEDNPAQDVFSNKKMEAQKRTPYFETKVKSHTGQNTERQGRSARKLYYDENIDDDTDTGEANIKINKIPQRNVNRSADKFKAENLFQNELATDKNKKTALKKVKSETETNEIVSIKVRHATGNEYREKISKIASHHGSQKNLAQTKKPEPILSRTSIKQVREDDSDLTKPSFFSQTKTSSIELSLTSEIKVKNAQSQVNSVSKNEYNYIDKATDKPKVSVEQLMQKALQFTERKNGSFLESRPTYETQLYFGVTSSPKSFTDRNLQHYASLQNTSRSTRFEVETHTSNEKAQPHILNSNGSKAEIKYPKNENLTIAPFGIGSPLAKKSDAPQYPKSFVQSPSAFVQEKEFHEFRNSEPLRASIQPEVVDLVDNMNEINKNLIDSIVRPVQRAKPAHQRKPSATKKAYIPSLNFDPTAINPPKEKSKNREREREIPLNPDYYTVKEQSGKIEVSESKKEDLARNLTQESTKKQNINKENQVRSGKESQEIQMIENQLKKNARFIEEERENLFKKRAEDLEIQNKIQQAIERSKRTYEYAANIDQRIPTPTFSLSYSSQITGGSITERSATPTTDYASLGQTNILTTRDAKWANL